MVQPLGATQQPGSSGPAAMASPNPGAMAQASAKVREAVQILSSALAEMPMGSEEQIEVSKCVTQLSKKFPQAESNPGIQNSMLRDLAQKAQQNQQFQALQRQMPQAQPPMGGEAGGEQPQA